MEKFQQVYSSVEKLQQVYSRKCGKIATSILKLVWQNSNKYTQVSSVADPDPNPDPNPDPDPLDPHVFGPPGSGSISQRYGSGSFYNHAKIVRKTLIPIIL
jgi:hypothetical protein